MQFMALIIDMGGKGITESQFRFRLVAFFERI